ncbi:hypothetical protein EVAR_53866_1 [Eumeta japonica]|uniref:Uncharacterized protein n=1 Tax=Eumeta variegata TaxID=151549 RepID=A0A4C1XFA4_EUMVA|nr:hypothetical protein EVAR_53866_1 [Eumeta japonica]
MDFFIAERQTSRWSPPPINIRKLRGATSALPASRKGIEYLMEYDQIDLRRRERSGPTEFSLTRRNATADSATSHSILTKQSKMNNQFLSEVKAHTPSLEKIMKPSVSSAAVAIDPGPAGGWRGGYKSTSSVLK